MSTQPRKPKTIPELFIARDKGFDRATNNIFAAMPGAMEALSELMGLEDIKKIGGDLIWDDVDIVDGDKEQLLVMVGIIVFPPGCELVTPRGDKVKVTPDTEPYFRRLVRAGLPVSIATQSKDEVVAYFKKMQEDAEKQPEVAELDKMLAQATEFDLSKLTEEQRRAYQEFNANVKPGKA